MTQTRSAVVTHGLEKQTDGYLTLFDSFVLFSSNTWPVQIVWCWLGGVPVTQGDRRHGPGYIPQPLAVRDTTSPTSRLNISGTKTTVKMSPNMACEALQSFSPRLTVAKRKEALELRKVSEATDFRLIILHFLYTQCDEWRKSPKCYVFFSDYETFDGKKKARSYQRQPEPFEKPHPSPHRQRCKLLRFSLNRKPIPCVRKSRQPICS